MSSSLGKTEENNIAYLDIVQKQYESNIKKKKEGNGPAWGHIVIKSVLRADIVHVPFQLLFTYFSFSQFFE